MSATRLGSTYVSPRNSAHFVSIEGCIVSRLDLPQLPASFWDHHPILMNIRDYAWSADNPCSADALLGCVLARVSVSTHYKTKVNGSSLNYFVAIVGASGTGKTTANQYAGKLIPDIETPLDSRPVGSGEGLIEAYLRTVKTDNGHEKKQTHTSALFYVDEGETFIRGTKRDASTTLGTLRSAWSGTVLGQQNASKDTTRHLAAHSYRMGLVIGFQPEYISELLADDAAGTPQRFLLVSSIDKNIPDVANRCRATLELRKPSSGEIYVDPEIKRMIRNNRLRIQRGEREQNQQDTHIDLMQLRTAALLSILCGSSDGVTPEWFSLAGTMTDNSRKIIQALQDGYRRADDAKQIAKVEQRIQTDEMIDDARMRRIARNLGDKAHRYGANEFKFLVYKIAARDRPYADVDDAVRRGYLVNVENTNHYVAGRMVDKT